VGEQPSERVDLLLRLSERLRILKLETELANKEHEVEVLKLELGRGNGARVAETRALYDAALGRRESCSAEIERNWAPEIKLLGLHIPLRVLRVPEHARSLNFFDNSFEIWCAPTTLVKDPILSCSSSTRVKGR